MKRLLYILAIVLLFSNCSYGQIINKSITVSDQKTDLKTVHDDSVHSSEDYSVLTNQIDSIYNINIDQVLIDAINLAKQNISCESFTKEYELNLDDSLFTIYVNLTYGYIFSNKYKQLIIHRISARDVFIDIYEYVDNDFNNILHRQQDYLTYEGDTIYDVNGDQLKDFIFHWYPASGCCLRNVMNVYLYQPENRFYANNYEFLNPTFSPKEKVIRGITYGQPGEVALYKFRWNGLKIDTVEYIYHNKSKFIKTKKPIYSDEKMIKINIKRVPDEYFKIEGFDWFIIDDK